MKIVCSWNYDYASDPAPLGGADNTSVINWLYV